MKTKTFKRNWNEEQLNAELAMYYARDWAKALRKYLKNPKDFHSAWEFLQLHPANMVQYRHGRMQHSDSAWEQNYTIMVVKVDPKTNRIERKPDEKRNTTTRVWIEWGPWMTAEDLNEHSPNVMPFVDGMPSHDPRVDTGGETFEEAVVNLAHNVWMLYRDRASVPNDAKLKKKDRW